MSKIIYQPKGKAKEYSPWAANFYNGCSNKCDYCYNRHCQAKALLGKDDPTLKKALKDEDDAADVFYKELLLYKDRIIADGKGLFFNFVSDPMLHETRYVNMVAIVTAIYHGVPCVVLTKCADWYTMFTESVKEIGVYWKSKQMVKFGFTLTGCDELEHGNSNNANRLWLMHLLHDEGYKTWASIEPVIDCDRSLEMVCKAAPFCDEFKVGLLSGKKDYTPEQVKELIRKINGLREIYGFDLVLKDSVYKFIG